jgi:sensor histidine kinase YesM
MRLKPNLHKTLRQTVIFNLVGTAIGIGLSFFAFTGGSFWMNATYAFIYSNCIGIFISAAVYFGAPLFESRSHNVRLAKYSAATSIAALCGVVCANVILSGIGLIPWTNVLPSRRFVGITLLITMLVGIGIYFYQFSQLQLAEAREMLRQKELDAALAKTLASEAQLASLESKIHPHFLFNTLNSIAALVREDPILAEKMVEQLAKLLRYSLDADSHGLVTIEQELKITADYLEIEKARFGERLDYKIQPASSFAQTPLLPPLALQTLVENSIKHVAAKSSLPTQIIVSNRKNGAHLEIEVSDNGAGFDETAIKANHGLDNLRKRLQAIFGERGKLEIANEISGACVRLKIPLTDE